MTLSFTVHGLPAPQGSKRHVGRGVMVESSKKVKPWREAVKWAAIEKLSATPWAREAARPMAVDIIFFLPMPKSIPKRDRSIALPAKRPDLDKLIRSTLDGIGEAGLWHDDSLVCQIKAQKSYCDPEGTWPVGASIVVREL